MNELSAYDAASPLEPSQLLETELGVPYYQVSDVVLDSTHAIASAGNYGAWAIAYK